MLAHEFDAKKHSPAGMYASEKLDGMRAFWDGGISTGLPKKNVPWANTTKDDRYLEPEIATGLWSRYGNVIHAPEWFLNQLPHILLDGELWAGPGNWQSLSSAVKKKHPCDDEWNDVKYKVFDSPPLDEILKDGKIDVPNFKKHFTHCVTWFIEHNDAEIIWADKRWYFEKVYYWLSNKMLINNDIVQCLEQVRLPANTEKATKDLGERLLVVGLGGGEGIILRKPMSFWIPERRHDVLKVKPLHDAEGIVTGYITGRRTDKGSKLLGKMGALILNFNGKRLELSGFTDEERTLGHKDHARPDWLLVAEGWAQGNPEAECPDWIEAPMFPKGSEITFQYRELSDSGIPKEARYWRKQ